MYAESSNDMTSLDEINGHVSVTKTNLQFREHWLWFNQESEGLRQVYFPKTYATPLPVFKPDMSMELVMCLAAHRHYGHTRFGDR